MQCICKYSVTSMYRWRNSFALNKLQLNRNTLSQYFYCFCGLKGEAVFESAPEAAEPHSRGQQQKSVHNGGERCSCWCCGLWSDSVLMHYSEGEAVKSLRLSQPFSQPSAGVSSKMCCRLLTVEVLCQQSLCGSRKSRREVGSPQQAHKVYILLTRDPI